MHILIDLSGTLLFAMGVGWGGQDHIRSSDSPIHVGPNDDRPSSAQRNVGRRSFDVVRDGDDNSDNDGDQCAKG